MVIEKINPIEESTLFDCFMSELSTVFGKYCEQLPEGEIHLKRALKACSVWSNLLMLNASAENPKSMENTLKALNEIALECKKIVENQREKDKKNEN